MTWRPKPASAEGGNEGRFQAREAGGQMGAQFGGVLDEPFIDQHIQGRAGHGAGEGIAAVCRSVDARGEHVHCSHTRRSAIGGRRSVLAA